MIERKHGMYFHSGLIDNGICYGAIFYNDITREIEVEYSDAVVVAQEGVNQELIDFAIASKKQVIEYAPFDEQKEKINALYDSLAVIEEE